MPSVWRPLDREKRAGTAPEKRSARSSVRAATRAFRRGRRRDQPAFVVVTSTPPQLLRPVFSGEESIIRPPSLPTTVQPLH